MQTRRLKELEDKITLVSSENHRLIEFQNQNLGVNDQMKKLKQDVMLLTTENQRLKSTIDRSSEEADAWRTKYLGIERELNELKRAN